MKKTIVCSLIVLTVMSVCLVASGQDRDPLTFDPEAYTVKTAIVEGDTVTYRAYTNISYVKNPVDTRYQYLNVYVPESAVDNQTVPIFFPNGIGGYKSSEPIVPAENAVWVPEEHNKGNFAALALWKGYVVVSPGGRGSDDEVDGKFTGKAPADIVDMKAAVRYLRYNDSLMPGDAEKIISNGTSAGGAMSALLGSTGNDKLYEPYLEALGAADAADNIFAAICFYPIIDLEHADKAYEWQFNRVMDGVDPEGKPYGFTDAQKAMSADLKALYPAYLESLGLTRVDTGEPLTDANMEDYLATFLIASAQKALDKGMELSDKAGLTISNGKVTDIDLDTYLSYVHRWRPIKDPPAFDWLGDQSTEEPRKFGSFENALFGSEDTPKNAYTDFVGDILGITISQDIKDRVYLMNPMNFVGKEGTDDAPYWYIRHGGKDWDTAFTVPVALYTALMNAGTTKEVDFEIAWDRPHSGDYELEEVLAWMDMISK